MSRPKTLQIQLAVEVIDRLRKIAQLTGVPASHIASVILTAYVIPTAKVQKKPQVRRVARQEH